MCDMTEVCVACEGGGTLTKLTVDHKEEYSYRAEEIPCPVCDGTGRMRKSTDE